MTWEPGDRKAWEHAIASGQFAMLDEEEIHRIALLAIYTWQEVDKRKGGMPQRDIETILAWASTARMENGLLENLLAGDLYVRVKKGKPAFSLTAKGTAGAEELARQMGLPVPNEEPPK